MGSAKKVIAGAAAAVAPVVTAPVAVAKVATDKYKDNKREAAEAAAAQAAQVAEYRTLLTEQQQAAKDLTDAEQKELGSTAARDTAKARQKNAAAAAIGRRDTILTGPLGLTNEPTTARKTLLGA